MIQQIISQTPSYVWALLALLVYRGYLASQDREVSLLNLSIMPAVMLVLALSGINTHGVLGSGIWGVWLAGALAGTALVWQFSRGDVKVNRAAGTVFQRGSWAPMALMAAIFITKYTVGVLSAMHPELKESLVFTLAVTALYGVFNGLFLGRLSRAAFAFLRQPAAA